MVNLTNICGAVEEGATWAEEVAAKISTVASGGHATVSLTSAQVKGVKAFTPVHSTNIYTGTLRYNSLHVH